jgi:hypothetical protein
MAVIAIGVLGFLVRDTLNPDGVAYLDLARTLGRGDIRDFAQGYWSPLYPALLAMTGTITGDSPARIIAAAHAINVIAVVGAIAVIWRWTRWSRSAWFGRAAIAALIVCSAEPPRVEAVTPDLILLCITTCIGYELIVRRGERWLLIGLLFGAAYLAKTSTWPWILFATALRTALAPDRPNRAITLRSHAATVVVILGWAIPVSVQAGHATLGVTARLNYRWYLESSDARTPDTHTGEHVQYHSASASDVGQITWADFGVQPQWTYQPWSDPDRWSQGIVTDHSTSPTPGWLVAYWVDTAHLAVTVWLRTLIVFVLIPAVWIARRPEAPQRVPVESRMALVASLLGLAGIVQYGAVHAEPRLLAPFALLLALAALDWLVGNRNPAGGSPQPRTPDRQVASLLGIAAAAYLAGRRIFFAIDDDHRIAAGLAALEEANRAAYLRGASSSGALAGAIAVDIPARPRIVVIGPALPVMANVFWIGGRIVAQVPPSMATVLAGFPADRQRDLLRRLFHDRADVLWLTLPDGSYQIVPVPRLTDVRPVPSTLP